MENQEEDGVFNVETPRMSLVTLNEPASSSKWLRKTDSKTETVSSSIAHQSIGKTLHGFEQIIRLMKGKGSNINVSEDQSAQPVFEEWWDRH